MKRRDLRLEKYGISKLVYMELYYFCRQYGEKRKSGNERDCRIIEEAAQEASNGAEACFESLMKNVTQDIPYHHLEVPCGKNQFVEMRHKFYFLVAQKLGKI